MGVSIPQKRQLPAPFLSTSAPPTDTKKSRHIQPPVGTDIPTSTSAVQVHFPPRSKNAAAGPSNDTHGSIDSAAGNLTPSPRSDSKTEETSKGADGFTKVPTREEKRKMRKLEKHRPAFQFDLGQFRSGKKVGIAHIRDFVLHLLIDSTKPQWIVTENKGSISHVLLLLIPGLLPSHIGLEIPIAASLPFTTSPMAPSDTFDSQIPYLNQIFLRGLPTRAPGDARKMHSVLQTLLQAPIPEGRRKELEKEKGREREERAANGMDGSDGDSPSLAYLLTPGQMIDNGYTLPSYLSVGDKTATPAFQREAEGDGALAGPNKLPSADKLDAEIVRGAKALKVGWTETPEARAAPLDGRWPILSVDCEMVETSAGAELARVSVVDYQTGLLVYDELVKPSGPVTNYRTQWSGMTPERLSKATHTLASVQSALSTGPAAIITPHSIMLGHSLECDLNALRIRHPLCLDTALMYKHPRGAPYKPALRWLSQRYLQKEIQGGKGGHDSEEDARACVGLLRLKIENGPEFGTFDENTESIFDRLARYTGSGSKHAEHGRTSAVCDYSNTKSGHGAKATTSTKCNDDDEVIDAILRDVEENDFVFGRMMDLANHSGFNGPENTPSSPSPLSEVLSKLNDRLTRLHAALPRNTAFILMNGHSDPRPMLEMTQRRLDFDRRVRENGGSTEGIKGEDRWMVEDDRELERRVAEAREGMAFFCVK